MRDQMYLNKFDARNVSKKRNIEKNKRKVAMYVRVSTEHEQQINALANQKQWAVGLANDNKDWVFNPETDLYVEEGLSGTSMKKRPAFEKMINKAKAGDYDLIAVREVCRFMRNAKLTLTLVDELLDAGVEVYFANDAIWSCNENDYFKLTIMAQYAEQESRKVSERVFSGQAIARENGIVFGNGNILGYNLIKGDKSSDTVYEINEEQAETVRKIYELSLKGNGVRKIRHYLMDNGYLTAEGKSNWHESTIERILRRSTYMGEITYFQSVTEDPLTHERNKVDKNKHIRIPVNMPRIIEPEIWHKVQEAINSRTNPYWKKGGKGGVNGIVENKDVYCRKLRCGCGRRFRRDYETKNNTSTYRCYELINDGSQKERLERSLIKGDNCSVYGIRDWKIDFYTLKVFEYLEYNTNEVKEILVSAVDKAFVDDIGSGYTTEDVLKIDSAIQKLKERKDRLLTIYLDGAIDEAVYIEREKEISGEIEKKQMLKSDMDKAGDIALKKEQTLKAVRDFLDKSLEFPTVAGVKIKVPEHLVDAYVNSIKACAGNVFEYNIKVNPKAEVQIPVIPDEEFNPQLHSAVNIIDNSDAVLLAEFEVGYDMAKNYANMRQRKVIKKQFSKPAIVRIYANL